MSEISNNDTLRHDIDLLVDGELAEERRRHLLRSLDNVSGGWRQLALAFLESQTMREAFAGGVEVEAERPASVIQPEAESRGTSPLTFWSAIAASFLVALAIGLSIRNDRAPVASNPPVDEKPEPIAETPADEDSKPAPIEKQPESVPVKRETSPNSLGEATLLVRNADGGQRRVQLPVFFSQEDDAARQLLSESAVPQHVIETMQRLGHRIEQRRNVVPIALDDGRQMYVPVDEVNVHYVGRPGYQ